MTSRKINRREFVHKTTIATIGLATVSQFGNPLFATPAIKNNRIAGKVFVLGIDGMDPNLLKRFMAQGQMPTFQKFVENNHFGTLGTTLPPQSPVAWSSFITGSNPGRNGIFDFIHRDPKHFKPYLSTARSFAADKRLNIGDWSIPIKGGGVELMRRGTPFWEILEANDIAAVLHKMPANYPVVPSSSNVISGMGTPDLLGSYGTFTLFSETDIPNGEKMSVW